MSRESLEEFRRLVFREPLLQERLKGEADREAFVAVMVRLGEESGCPFTPDEVEMALNEARRAWIEP